LKSESKLLHYHQNWWRVENSEIWLLAGKDSEDSEHLTGWYFSDEIESFHGPFNSQQQAETALANYVRQIL